MAPPDTSAWLIAGYSLILVAIGWCFDVMARHASARAAAWRTGQFRYRPDHDAWVCPQDHWLWPTSFDPKHRVMRYRALPVVCNSCPVKSTCTTSDHGREISRDIDPWPHSEAGRFHRGIACSVAAFGIVLPMATLVTNHSPADALVLTGTAAVVVLFGLPLARHLWNTPANAPEHLPHRTAIEDQVAAAIDRYSTRWGGWEGKEEQTK
ncbi:hypothetical protein [Mycobacterium asiaticum]|uniref:Transposase DDE domain-containing protein n=1 Tax=Mycobacterium asiaticum TaxID=1790 RepID=A0A1A3L075_MYCAS|nr:hypothetical protein [Mycobacterium asiaticum]OBI86876.1 hypothetical protein A5661_09315 [Mycobacterium asiaticum]OBJ90013.1 hypothetical protein A5640_25860 [Mycobacterium asiaticum]